MKRLAFLAFLAFLATLFIASSLHGAGRHALILCNQSYKAIGELRTPLAEAREAEKTLATLGFAGNITVVTDATTAKMTEAVDVFAAKLKDAEVALFFYGGHAIQAAGENYLLGVDSDPATTSQLAYKALPLGRVLTNLEGSGARLNLLILDCCRDNPLPTRGRNVGSTRGLAPMANAPKGTFIAYAADANQQAWDDHGQIGLYGSVLFEKMKTPGLRLEDIFIQTREEVARIATEKYQHQQEPAEYSKVKGPFFFMHPQKSNAIVMESTIAKDSASSQFKPQALNQRSTLPERGFFDSEQLFSTGPYANYSPSGQKSILEEVQRKLRQQGLYLKEIDGLPGNGTQEAIFQYQESKFLKLTGMIDIETLQSLNLLEIKDKLAHGMRPLSLTRIAGLRKLEGVWIRTDEAYEIHILRIYDNGEIKARYHNPSLGFVRVHSAYLLNEESGFDFYMKLDPSTYNGSEYRLSLANNGQLVGQYLWAPDAEAELINIEFDKK
jgi:hypothetical protein